MTAISGGDAFVGGQPHAALGVEGIRRPLELNGVRDDQEVLRRKYVAVLSVWKGTVWFCHVASGRLLRDSCPQYNSRAMRGQPVRPM
jgi:hypothetical protein